MKKIVGLIGVLLMVGCASTPTTDMHFVRDHNLPSGVVLSGCMCTSTHYNLLNKMQNSLCTSGLQTETICEEYKTACFPGLSAYQTTCL